MGTCTCFAKLANSLNLFEIARAFIFSSWANRDERVRIAEQPCTTVNPETSHAMNRGYGHWIIRPAWMNRKFVCNRSQRDSIYYHFLLLHTRKFCFFIWRNNIGDYVTLKFNLWSYRLIIQTVKWLNISKYFL